MEFDFGEEKSLSKKERRELRRKQRFDEIKKFRRLIKLNKIIFWTVLAIIVVGGLYIMMVAFGYTSATMPLTLAKVKY